MPTRKSENAGHPFPSFHAKIIMPRSKCRKRCIGVQRKLDNNAICTVLKWKGDSFSNKRNTPRKEQIRSTKQ